MSDENNNGRNSAPGGRQPLTLKPRGAGSVSAGTVKQSFSHGRSKTVVVETKRPRTHAPAAGNLAAPSSAEKRVFDTRAPQSSQAPRQQGAAGGPGDGLSAEERAARARAAETFARQQQARQEDERRARDERARAEAEAAQRAAQAQAAAQAAQAPAPPPAE